MRRAPPWHVLEIKGTCPVDAKQNRVDTPDTFQLSDGSQVRLRFVGSRCSGSRDRPWFFSFFFLLVFCFWEPPAPSACGVLLGYILPPLLIARPFLAGLYLAVRGRNAVDARVARRGDSDLS